MDTNDANDSTYKLKLASDDSPSLLFSKVNSSGKIVMSELASSNSSVLAIDFQRIFEHASKSQKTKLMASRLKIDGQNQCIAWNKHLRETEEYDAEELFTPISFSFAAGAILINMNRRKATKIREKGRYQKGLNFSKLRCNITMIVKI